MSEKRYHNIVSSMLDTSIGCQLMIPKMAKQRELECTLRNGFAEFEDKYVGEN